MLKSVLCQALYNTKIELTIREPLPLSVLGTLHQFLNSIRVQPLFSTRGSLLITPLESSHWLCYDSEQGDIQITQTAYVTLKQAIARMLAFPIL